MFARLLLLLTLSQVGLNTAWGVDLSGRFAVEQDYFLEPNPQRDWQSNRSIRLDFNAIHEYDADTLLSLSLAARLDQQDSERTYVSVEEAIWQHYFASGWSVKAGYLKTFWGVSEAYNPVNILNQTRLNEGIDGKDRIAQPTLNLTYDSGNLILDAYLLTDFQDRQYPGRNGRPTLPLPVLQNQSTYDSNPGFDHIDAALRAQWLFGNLQLATSYFQGLDREADFDLSITPGQAAAVVATGQLPDDHNASLIPNYRDLHQIGIEMVYLIDNLQLKGELVKRNLKNTAIENHFRSNVGLEYNQFGVSGTRKDLTFYTEYLFDNQKNQIRPLFDRDIFLGARLDFNDFDGSVLEFGIVHDIRTQDALYDFNYETRLTDSVKFGLEALFFDSRAPAYNASSFTQDLILGQPITQPVALFGRESALTLSIQFFW